MKKAGFAVVIALFAGVTVRGQSSPTWVPVSRWSNTAFHCPKEGALLELARRAETGDVGAQDIVGTFNVSMCPGEKDAARGMALLERAAGEGNVHAQLTLGEAWRDRKSGQKDEKKAASWFEKAATSGDARSQNNLGVAYQVGQGVKKDASRAVKLFQSAAEQGLPEAKYNLATMLDRGQGVARSYILARKWYSEAAEHNDAAAEYRLAMLWEKGLGGDQDPEQAMQWLKRAAGHGSEEAQVRLGQKQAFETHTVESGFNEYSAGMAMLQAKDVRVGQALALSFLQKSAKMGYSKANFQLGRMFETGEGVQKDEAQALEYYERAIAHDSQDFASYNHIAWICVASKNSKIRNPQKALQYATKAVELTGGQSANELDTLAHAYFLTGDIDKALETEAKAASLAPTDESIQKTLAEYKRAQEQQPAAK